MEAIGRLIDPVYVPNANLATTWVSLKDCEAITVLVFGAGGATNVTVQVAKDASGTGAANYATTAGDGITRFLRKPASTQLWSSTGSPQAAAATIATTATSGDVLAFDIAGYQVAAGYYYVGLTHATANALFIPHDLLVQRKPVNLRNLTA